MGPGVTEHHDHELVERLREGDESAFAELIDMYGATMLRVAQMYVRDRATAEEVVQETWLAVLNGIDRFEERSSLKTWLFRILTNRAKTRGEREARSVPFSAVALADASGNDPAVDADRFQGPSDRHPGGWAVPPARWETLPDERLLSKETLRIVHEAVDRLPPAQREVIRLRDIEGWDAEEVCEALGVTHGNQRVLLHRARAKVRTALERYLGSEVMVA
jgi:RNA polymerase sigma-70 factor (ECF subfamily)